MHVDEGIVELDYAQAGPSWIWVKIGLGNCELDSLVLYGKYNLQ